MALSLVSESRRRKESTNNNGLRIALIVIAGTITIAIITAVSTLPFSHALQIAGIAVSAAAAATIAGAGVLYVARHRSLGTQAGLLALVAVAGAALGAWGVAQAMFLSKHDFNVLIVVLTSAGIAASVGASILGQHIDAGARRLVDIARRIDGSAPVTVDSGGHPRELARLAAELSETSLRLADVQSRSKALEASRRELMAWISGDLRELVARADSRAHNLDTAEADSLRNDLASMRRVIDDLLELNGTPSETSVSSAQGA